MYGGSWGAYAYAGVTAVQCIRAMLEKYDRPAPVHFLDLPCGHGRELRFLKVVYPDGAVHRVRHRRGRRGFLRARLRRRAGGLEGRPGRGLVRRPVRPCVVRLAVHPPVRRPLAKVPGPVCPGARARRACCCSAQTGSCRLGSCVTSASDPPGVEKLLHDFEHEDFGYVDVADGTWGLSIARPRWVKEQIERSPLELLSYERWAWKPPFPAQDVLVCTLPAELQRAGASTCASWCRCGTCACRAGSCPRWSARRCAP